MNILKEGNSYKFIENLEIINHLDVANYILKFDEKFNTCWLEKSEEFTFPDKLYDIDSKLIEYVDVDFQQTKDNLGVLLVGSKGQGKSLTAKQLAVKTKLPVIIIKDKIPSGVDFITFLSNIKQDYVLFVDEFEKLFNQRFSNADDDYHNQNIFLSFMDGVVVKENKILFLLTTNDDINDYFINRPSRVKYVKEYIELPEDVLNEIIEDRLKNKEFKEDLINNVSLVNLNVDLLISIINNINLFNKPFSEFSELFNYRFENYKYEINIINKDGSREFKDVYVDSYKPTVDEDYLFGYNVVDVTMFTNDLIHFSAWKKDGNKNKIYLNIEAKRIYGNKIPTTVLA